MVFNPPFTLNDKHMRMIEDDNFYDVTKEDVKSLLLRLPSVKATREEIIKMRIKYDPWIDDAEKRLMEELGLDYRFHVITRGSLPAVGVNCTLPHPGCKSIYINGFTKTQWKMLTDEKYVPNMLPLIDFISRCEKANEPELVDTLVTKYKDLLDAREQKILEKNGLPLDAGFKKLTYNQIDGRSFYRWRLLFDDNFVPASKAVLFSSLAKMRNGNPSDVEDAEAIEQKYLTFLYPEIDTPDMQAEVEAARTFFRELFPYAFT